MRKRSVSPRRGRKPDQGGLKPLGQTAEYALRAMTVLAQPDQPPQTAADLAAATRVPVHYLSKVLRRLVAAGLLVSQKGHGGGFVLARPAAQIRFAEVLEATGGAPETGRCAFGWGNCDARHPCPLHPVWSSLNDSLVAWANRATLADVGTVLERKPPRSRLSRGARPTTARARAKSSAAGTS